MRNVYREPAAPPPDPEVVDNGTIVFRTKAVSALLFEVWVGDIARLSGQKVDWYVQGEHAVVKALGDLDAVRDAMRELMPAYDRMFAGEMRITLGEDQAKRLAPPRPDWW
jgi:hypothetical protein